MITFIKNFKVNKNKKNKLSQVKKKYIDNHIQNFKSGKDASDKIIDIMNKFSFKKETSQFDLIKGNIILEMNLFKLKLARKFYKNNFLYLKSKCPKMDLKNVNEILNSLQNRKTGGKKFKTFKLTNYSIVIDKA